MMATAIVVAEMAFWIFLAAGLTARYALRRPHLGAVLLLGSPVADVALLVTASVDLHRGATATQMHALAAVYVGFAVAFGHRTVARADEWFAQRFAGTPRPVHDERDRLTRTWALFRRAAVGWAVASAILLALSAVAGDVNRAAALLGYIGVLTVSLAIWFLIDPLPAQLAAGRTSALSNKTGDTDMQRNKPSNKPTGDRVWAPWWLYLVVILGANYARQAVMPFGAIPEWAVVLVVLAGSVALFGIVTAAYRVARR